VPPPPGDDRIAAVFIGEGGSQNGRMAEVLNSASKDKLPLLIVVIDNGRAINTFTPDVAQNSDVYKVRGGRARRERPGGFLPRRKRGRVWVSPPSPPPLPRTPSNL
jgi:hypothetical protein